MTITEAMIEAGVVALYDDFAERMGYTVRYAMLDERAKAVACQSWGPRVSMVLTAALAAAEAEGVVLCVVPGEMDHMTAGTQSGPQFVTGHNACRAAVLAGRVVV
jgi:hypothetical protein